MELLTFLLESDDIENFEENLSIITVEEKDSKGFTILHLAVQEGKYDFVDALMYHGADPNVENKNHETPLHIAAKKDFHKIFKLLWEYGAHKIFKLLWEYGADLEQEDYKGRTPKDIALENSSKRVLREIEEIEED